jgi:hypothetical protein
MEPPSFWRISRLLRLFGWLNALASLVLAALGYGFVLSCCRFVGHSADRLSGGYEAPVSARPRLAIMAFRGAR